MQLEPVPSDNLELGDNDNADFTPPARPRTRGECIHGPRPCPWLLCRHHLAVDVGKNRIPRLAWPGRELDELPETCSLDVADRGAINLAQIAALMGLSRERARQLESDGLSHLLANLRTPFDD